MRVVGIKILKNKLSEYIRIAAAGERVLVTMQFLREQGVALELATYDQRMREAAVKMKIPLHW